MCIFEGPSKSSDKVRFFSLKSSSSSAPFKSSSSAYLTTMVTSSIFSWVDVFQKPGLITSLKVSGNYHCGIV